MPPTNDPPATLNSLGMVVTVATWVVLVGVNLWCLRKLLRGDPELADPS